MEWLAQNWILVLAGIVLLVFILRRSGAARTHGERAGSDPQAGRHQHRRGGHGRHGGC